MADEPEESDTRLDPPFPFAAIPGGWGWLDVPANPSPLIDTAESE